MPPTTLSQDYNTFEAPLAENIFQNKYALFSGETWSQRAEAIVDAVVGFGGGQYNEALLSKDDRDLLYHLIASKKFLPGGRYIYYSGRPSKMWNSCFMLRAEHDTREEWASLMQRSVSCLMTGGGIGVDYSILRAQGKKLSRTGGEASGPIPLMQMINESGRGIIQGGSRRSAIFGSLNWQHEDFLTFLKSKNWDEIAIPGTSFTYDDIKKGETQAAFNFPAPLDMTNISGNYDNVFLDVIYGGMWAEDSTGIHPWTGVQKLPDLFIQNVRQALRTGDPGFSFNFGSKENEILRNPCCEVVSRDDSDVCNLGSLNLERFDNLEEFREAVRVATKFLVCGTIRAELPYDKVYVVRERNRRLGLGIMGIAAWLLRHQQPYGMNDDLRQYLSVYKTESEKAANIFCDSLGISRPVAYRAIAPTGSIGIMASTTTGIEPLYAVAYKRRYLTHGTKWVYQYYIDETSRHMIEHYGLDAERIDSAQSLALEFERRIAFQADVQDYVDQAISSTNNLPSWGSEFNNEDLVIPYAKVLASYAHRLRGFTVYPDGSRGGQPLTPVPYQEAAALQGVVFEENDSCKGGVCSI